MIRYLYTLVKKNDILYIILLCNKIVSAYCYVTVLEGEIHWEGIHY